MGVIEGYVKFFKGTRSFKLEVCHRIAFLSDKSVKVSFETNITSN